MRRKKGKNPFNFLNFWGLKGKNLQILLYNKNKIKVKMIKAKTKILK